MSVNHHTLFPIPKSLHTGLCYLVVVSIIVSGLLSSLVVFNVGLLPGASAGYQETGYQETGYQEAVSQVNEHQKNAYLSNVPQNWQTRDKVLICTSQGLKWVSLSSLQSSQAESHTKTDHQTLLKSHCPVFKLHPGNHFNMEGAFLLIIALVSYRRRVKPVSSPFTISKRFYRFAPKHSPPLDHVNSTQYSM